MRRRAALGAVALLLAARAASGDVFAIVGATVHTVGEAGPIEAGTVLVRDGVIEAVGAGLALPEDVRRIDAAGKVLTPGLFDPYSYLGLVEVSAVEETVDDRQQGDRYAASFEVGPAFNPRSTLIAVNRIDGVTRAAIVPRPADDGSDVISGLGAVVHLGEAETAMVAPRAALFAQYGELGAALAGGSRAAAALRLREVLEDAADFARNRRGYAEGRRREYAASRLDLEALQPVLAADIPLVLTVHRASDIRAALRLARETGIRLAIRGGAESWMVADELAGAGVAVILDPTANLPASFESLDASLLTARRLHAAGVAISFAEATSHNARNLRQLAGNAVAHGLPWEAALAAITRNPARLYGQDRSGAVEVGMVADLVVWSGDPLEVTTHAERVYIGGEAVPMRSRQTLLRDRYRQLDRGLPPAYVRP